MPGYVVLVVVEKQHQQLQVSSGHNGDYRWTLVSYTDYGTSDFVLTILSPRDILTCNNVLYSAIFTLHNTFRGDVDCFQLRLVIHRGPRHTDLLNLTRLLVLVLVLVQVLVLVPAALAVAVAVLVLVLTSVVMAGCPTRPLQTI